MDGDLVQGLAWIAGGVSLTVTMFGLAARRDRKMNLSSPRTWYLDSNNVVISGAMMAVGALMFIVSRKYAEEDSLALYTGGFGVAVFVIALIWFTLSVRD